MKQIRMIFAAIACVALLCAAASTATAASALLPMDNTWFQVDVAVKGEALDYDDGTVDKASVQRTAYMFIEDNSGDYSYVMFSETSVGVWSATGGGSIDAEFITDDGTFMYAQPWIIVAPDSTVLMFYMSGKFKVKLNKDDSLKKASFSCLNASIMPGPFDSATNEWLFGKIKIKAKMIDEDKLPAGVPLP